MLSKQQLWDQAPVICIHRNQQQNRPYLMAGLPTSPNVHELKWEPQERGRTHIDKAGVGWPGQLDGESAALGNCVIVT